MNILNVLTATWTAFSTVLSHPGRVLLTLASLSPEWALDLVCTVITTAYCVIEEAESSIVGYLYHQLNSEQHCHSFHNNTQREPAKVRG